MTVIALDDFQDTRELKPSLKDKVRRIRNLMNDCDKYNIDYDIYLSRTDFDEVIKILECCLEHKNSKYIARKR